ncbi:unnamed protein product, partial [Polarella glacialis]
SCYSPRPMRNRAQTLDALAGIAAPANVAVEMLNLQRMVGWSQKQNAHLHLHNMQLMRKIAGLESNLQRLMHLRSAAEDQTSEHARHVSRLQFEIGFWRSQCAGGSPQGFGSFG